MLRPILLLVLLLSDGLRAAQAQAVPRLKPIAPQVQMPALAQLPFLVDYFRSGPGNYSVQVFYHDPSKNQTAKNEKGTATERQQVRLFLTK